MRAGAGPGDVGAARRAGLAVCCRAGAGLREGRRGLVGPAATARRPAPRAGRLAVAEAGPAASEAVSGEAAVPEMAGSERRGLGRGGPGRRAPHLLLLLLPLLLRGCSGRIHRLALTVSVPAGRSSAPQDASG